MWYSQSETQQDQWVIETLKGKRNGFFLEIGAYDGITHSNTFALEQEFGWTGDLVEAVSEYVSLCRTNRPAVDTHHCTIGPDFGVYKYFVAQQWSGIKAFMRHDLLVTNTLLDHPTRKMWTMPLSLLMYCNRAPSVIDYFSLDTEGSEYAILEAYFNNQPRTQFRCMTVEVGTNGDDLDKLTNLLANHGYVLDKVQAWEAYYVNPRLL